MRAINVSNVQACCRPASAIFIADSGRWGLADLQHFTPDTPLTPLAGDIRIWRTNGFDCYFL
jgi:hypothetical protein